MGDKLVKILAIGAWEAWCRAFIVLTIFLVLSKFMPSVWNDLLVRIVLWIIFCVFYIWQPIAHKLEHEKLYAEIKALRGVINAFQMAAKGKG